MAQINIREFPDDLHHDLKVAAAQSGKTMRELIIEKLEAAVANPARKTR